MEGLYHGNGPGVDKLLMASKLRWGFVATTADPVITSYRKMTTSELFRCIFI